jgi:hypothetical protein
VLLVCEAQVKLDKAMQKPRKLHEHKMLKMMLETSQLVFSGFFNQLN